MKLLITSLLIIILNVVTCENVIENVELNNYEEDKVKSKALDVPYPLELCQRVMMKRTISTQGDDRIVENFCPTQCKLAWENPHDYGCPVNPNSDGQDFLDCIREIFWVHCIDRRVKAYDIRIQEPLAQSYFMERATFDGLNKLPTAPMILAGDVMKQILNPEKYQDQINLDRELHIKLRNKNKAQEDPSSG